MAMVKELLSWIRMTGLRITDACLFIQALSNFLNYSVEGKMIMINLLKDG
uniref:Uncharacterized protein n=1 Tax=Octopus bimaculoides TaxID=37653 RepID=A0A0L8GKL0_OCTBM